MAVEIAVAPRRLLFQPISWPAIFAALAVGISVQLFLILVGLAVGISVFEPAETSGRAMSLGATGWSAASMIIAAFVGGYIASRASGLRRKGDGMLHGAIAWAASTLLYAVLATTVLGNATAGVFSAMRPLLASALPAVSQPMADAGDNSTQTQTQLSQSLESMGLSPTQVQSVMDQVAVVRGDPNASPQAIARTEESAEKVAAATAWLSLAVLLSLVAAVLGGLTGIAGQRRTRRRAEVSVTQSDARIFSRSPA